MSFLLRSGFQKGRRHPGEAELLRYIDGELSANSASKIRTHLEACWICRLRAEKIQRTISYFVDSLLGAFSPGNTVPPKRWSTFDAHFRRVVAEAGNRALCILNFRSLTSLLSHFLFRPAAALLAVIVLVL